MKKLLGGLSILLLLGSGCTKLRLVEQPLPAPQEPVEQLEKVSYPEEKPLELTKTYVSTIGKFSFDYPDVKLEAVNEKLSPTSRGLQLFNVSSTGEMPDNTFPILIFNVVKATVYPETKLGQLRAHYLKGVEAEVKQIKINDVSGWEVKVTSAIDEIQPFSRLLYFPHGSNELVILDLENSELTERIINSLKSVK